MLFSIIFLSLTRSCFAFWSCGEKECDILYECHCHNYSSINSSSENNNKECVFGECVVSNGDLVGLCSFPFLLSGGVYIILYCLCQRGQKTSKKSIAPSPRETDSEDEDLESVQSSIPKE